VLLQDIDGSAKVKQKEVKQVLPAPSSQVKFNSPADTTVKPEVSFEVY
jgi:hypothetical protein